MVDFRCQQDEPAGEHRENLQEVPGLTQHGLPLSPLEFVEKEGTPGVIQGGKQDEQEVTQGQGAAVVTHRCQVQHVLKHQLVALSQNQICQIVKNRRDCQIDAEFPIILPVKGLAPKKDPDADGNAQEPIGGGVCHHPAIVADAHRQPKHQHHRQHQRNQRNRQRQQHIPACPVLIDIFDVQEIDAEGTEGLNKHQAYQSPIQLKHSGNGRKENQHKPGADRKGQHR